MKIHRTNFLYSLSAIRKSAFSHLEAAMAEAGITDLPPSFGDILYIIHTQGEIFINELATLSHKDKSTVSNSIKQLEKRGYVEKIASRDDARKVKVKLSPKAKSHMKAMAAISDGLQKKLFEKMSEEEQAILFLLLSKIGKNMKD
ncbi:MAG: MarR family transcriptional regulator [Desulfobacterales bacterium]|nr:MarR family transcriptional regulator [Desulfobacterales bacterium]